ncbi:MAG: tetratricopeptide repeat protein [Euryarchaeota archaeon]|nr:tetratricopeptide repeat protein [Euryarchaeota archaeon]
MKIGRRTAIGVTLIVLLGLSSWGLTGALEEQKYIDLGKAEYNRGNYDGALYLFNKAIALNPDNEYLYNDRGLCYVVLGDIDNAISDFSKAIELKSDFLEAYYNRGLAYFGGGKWRRALDNEEGNKAIADFTKVIELDPEYVEAYNNRGLVYSEYIHYYYKPFDSEIIDKYNNALADFDKVLELDPTYMLAHAGKGNLYYRYGDFDNGTAEFDKALESEELIIQEVSLKGLAAVYYSRGRNYGGGHHMVYEDLRGTLDYEKAIELDPTLMTALGHVTGSYQRLGEWNKLIENCDYMLDLKKDDPAWLTKSHGGYTKYEAKGLAYYNLGQYDEAITNYNRVIELKPTVGAYRGVGIVYSEIGASENATEAFDKAFEMDTNIIEEGTYTWGMYSKYYSRGLTYYAMQDYDKAISDFDKAIELKSDYAEAYTDLGKAYLGIGDKAKANEAFETAISLFEEQGNSYAAEQVKELLGLMTAESIPMNIGGSATVSEEVYSV